MTGYHPSGINCTLTKNFSNLNRLTLASFDSTVQSHEGYGMLLYDTHIFF